MGEHIPTFEGKEEEARYWEKTGLDQLSPDEYEKVDIERPERPLSATFAVRFDPEAIELIRRVARSQGLGPTQLVRSWVLERLKIERAVGVLAPLSSDFPSEFELRLRKTILDTLLAKIPAAAEAAMQDVLERAEQERANLPG